MWHRKIFSSASDEALMQIWQEQRDSDAYHALFKRYHKPLKGFCRNLLNGHEEDAEEITMEVFEIITTTPLKYQLIPGHTFKSWLYEVAKNHCYNLLRKNRRLVGMEAVDERAAVHIEMSPRSAEDEAVSKLEVAELMCLMRQMLLDEDDRAIFLLRYQAERSESEIAAAMGCNVNWVKARLRRRIKPAVDKIKARLEESAEENHDSSAPKSGGKGVS